MDGQNNAASVRPAAGSGENRPPAAWPSADAQSYLDSGKQTMVTGAGGPLAPALSMFVRIPRDEPEALCPTTPPRGEDPRVSRSIIQQR
jgi:hypothetical protein